MGTGIYRGPSGSLRFTATATHVAGEIVQLADGRAAMITSDLAIGETGEKITSGIIRVPVESGTAVADGGAVAWDADPGEAVAPGAVAGDHYLGRAIEAKDTDNFVQVDLNAGADLEFVDYSGLPTSDPGVSGLPWLNSNVLTISA